MKLAISNIAWTRDEEAAAADQLAVQGVRAIEIAPTKAWDKPLDASASDIAAYRDWWTDRGFEIVALQSLNYGQAHLQIFSTPALRAEFLDYLRGIINLGAQLGAKVFVFGSPKNRLVGDMPQDDIMAIAVPFFRTLGSAAAAHDASFCIEPNPTDYGCDFVTTTAQGIDLVRAVNHPGFGLHLDAAGAALAGDDPTRAIAEAMPMLRHFHLSAPFLNEVGPGPVDHQAITTALKAGGYAHTLSIEMKPGDAGTNLARTQRAVAFAQATYPIS